MTQDAKVFRISLFVNISGFVPAPFQIVIGFASMNRMLLIAHSYPSTGSLAFPHCGNSSVATGMPESAPPNILAARDTSNADTQRSE
jgi:hypothetical protein